MMTHRSDLRQIRTQSPSLLIIVEAVKCGDQLRATYRVCKVQECGRTLFSLVVDWVGNSR